MSESDRARVVAVIVFSNVIVNLSQCSWCFSFFILFDYVKILPSIASIGTN